MNEFFAFLNLESCAKNSFLEDVCVGKIYLL